MSSPMFSGTTCHETPQRSMHQPQRSASGTADSPAQNRSISSWLRQVTTIETPGLKVKS